jgi:hypothetical protein
MSEEVMAEIGLTFGLNSQCFFLCGAYEVQQLGILRPPKLAIKKVRLLFASALTKCNKVGDSRAL